MSKMNFTPSQSDAINARGGSILVSAAAGSGKTRVLVQRVIKLITDNENHIDADRLLIVTYTNAAAAEMKSRISSAIEELLVNDPDNTLLHRQQMLIPRSDICTIHSFCSRIIKENFYSLNINQNYRIGSSNELYVIRNNVMSDIIEEMYAQNRTDFILLSDNFSSSKSDSELEKILLSVYDFSCSHPFPEDFVMESVDFYNPNIPLLKTIFAKKAFDSLTLSIKFLKSLICKAQTIIDENIDLQNDNKTSAKNVNIEYSQLIDNIEKAKNEENWDLITEIISNYSKKKYMPPRGKNVILVEEDAQTIKACFEAINNTIVKKLQPLFGFTQETYRIDTEKSYPIIKCLSEIILEFSKRYEKAKNEKGILDFSDLEHLMLKLLVCKTDKGYQKTSFADNLSKQYDEIMIDEYQDTNETQELIFNAISKDENNLFVVGDVKQSIYSFREAMPEIFINRREKCKLYDRENPSFPAKIILDKNFRSREGIIDSVNFTFGALMSKRVGEIEYNDDEKLTYAASYPEKDEPELELHLIEKNKSETDNFFSTENELSNDEAEAAYTAKIIKKMIDEKFTITDGNEQRPVEYRDFCILMRNLSSHSKVFSDVLNQNGVPAYTNKEYSLFECYEVNTAIAFLKVTDNPLQDIPMLSLMLCPIAGFTSDDIVLMKTKIARKNLYGYIYAFSQLTNDNINADTLTEEEKKLSKKCLSFFETLLYFRKKAVTMSVSKLIDLFFEKTGFVSVMSAMKNGHIRIKNLKKLKNIIREYENSGKNSLMEFIRFLNYLEENGEEIKVTDTAPYNSVKIMSVHHSKGLEFPICIMAATSARGDTHKSTVLCHSRLGFGITVMDNEKMLKYSTLQRAIIENEIKQENKSEEMRVLYVAMTRAKEKLIVLASINKKSDKKNPLTETAVSINITDGKIDSASVENTSTIAQRIIMAALVHPSMKELREDADVPYLETIPTKSKWKYFHIKDVLNETPELENEIYTPQIDNEMTEFLKKRFLQSYKFETRTKLPSKVSASALAHNDTSDFYIAKMRPAFMQEKNMTSAERGTALHKFFECCDFEKLYSNIFEEKQRILKNGFMSDNQIEALNDNDIKKFIESKLFERMLKAEKLYKEQQFTVEISACDVDENADCDDRIILQGAMDCVFSENGKLTIVDYKTDKIKDINDLALLYKKQLKLYQKAAEQVFELPVSECIIYSLHLGEQISIDL